MFGDFLYRGDDHNDRWTDPEARALYNPPTVFEYGKNYKVMDVPKSGGDGQAVEIWETRMPARFYEIHALPGVNSVNTPKAGFKLGTGSSGEDLSWSIAKAITEGMLVLIEEK